MRQQPMNKHILSLMIVLLAIAGLACQPGTAMADGQKPRRVEKATLSLPEVEALLQKRRQQAIQWVEADRADVRSKLGGLPDLPPGIAWPYWQEQPLAFIAQLDLSAMPRLDALSDMPSEGMLYVFYDAEQSAWGSDPKDKGAWRVIYAQTLPGPGRVAAPRGLAADAIYKEKRLVPRVVSSYPTIERLDSYAYDFPDTAYDKVKELRERALGSGPEHQLGGYPNPVQGEGMEQEAQLASHGIDCRTAAGCKDPRVAKLAKGAGAWRLLLQIDTDDDTGMSWGDGGKLYFWITREALSRRDFSQIWMTMQSY